MNKYRDALKELDQLQAAGKVTPEQYGMHKTRLLQESSKRGSAVKTPAIVAAVFLAIGGFGWLTSPHPELKAPVTETVDTPTYRTKPVADVYHVVYDVTGDATQANLTYSTPTGNSQQQGVDVPLTMKGSDERGMTVDGFTTGDFLYLSAQNADDHGSVTCQIKVDFKVVSENTATGPYAIATCQSSL